jgi:two-component system CheB/CheR fusion protein
MQGENPEFPMEYRWKVRAGEYRWFSDHRKPVFDQHGKVESLVGVSRDITHLKNLEEGLKQVQEQLQKSNAFMENLLYMAAHDLKSPLSSLSMLLQLLSPASEEERLQLGMIRKMVNRLNEVIHGLIVIIRSLHQEDNLFEEILLQKEIDEILNMHKPALAEKEGEIQVEIKGIHSMIYLRPFLRSILNNLLSNAIKYSAPERKPLIHLSVESVHEYVLFVIRDNGIGIDLKKVNKQLFSPFKRFHDNATGSGIGGFIVKSLIEKNGGRIEVESTPGEGTTVKCYLKEYSVIK